MHEMDNGQLMKTETATGEQYDLEENKIWRNFLWSRDGKDNVSYYVWKVKLINKTKKFSK